VQKQQSGFTLVEIAIVLVIIGLLLGGVLKGQELINQAKVKNVANDLNGVGAAVYAYQDRYKALPGDDDGAAARWTTAPVPPNGNRNGILDAPAGGTDETLAFWLHLRRAGLISGDAASNAPPFNAVNGSTTIHSAAANFSGVVICTSTLPGKIAEAVDSQFDDGRPNTGTVRATLTNVGVDAAANLAVTAVAAYSDDGATVYRICKQI
jgi:prepilin-type N-terminal cleavage/methylation domain-containing protein